MGDFSTSGVSDFELSKAVSSRTPQKEISNNSVSEHKLFIKSDDKEKNGDISDSDIQSSSSPCCTPICSAVQSIQESIYNFFSRNWTVIRYGLIGLLTVLYTIYFIAACIMDFQRAKWLVIWTSALVVAMFYKIIKSNLGRKIRVNCWAPLCRIIKPKWTIIRLCLIVAVSLFVLVVTAVIIGPRVEQYRGVLGLMFFVLFLYVTSANPAKVNWRPVLWGMLLNYVFAIFILKTYAGYWIFETLGEQIRVFLGYTDVGSAFIFKNTDPHPFAFKILPTIIFFSCVISLLYYMGAMQLVIEKIAFVMQLTMGTSPTESLSCAGNIFVGQTEAPILIRPFLPDMTMSELHAVMTGGFATIAGGVLAAYIGMGVDPVHLICASVMNAPMSLGVSKLYYPETEEPTYLQGNEIKVETEKDQNFIAAAAAGASQSIGLVANIAANLIAFLALKAFCNAILSWFGAKVDFPELSFEIICSYLFWPVAWLMGAKYDDCLLVGELLGTKIFINEFIAYEKLSELASNRETCLSPSISERSQIIVTYALCGFANISSVGVQLGGIGAMAPTRKADLAKLAVRALIAGSVTTMMTACLASMLTNIPEVDAFSAQCINQTSLSMRMNGTLLNDTLIAANSNTTLLDGS